MGNIYMGYMGSADIGGTKVKITGSSLNPAQTVEAPDLVQGFYNKSAWVYGKIETGGNITGPLGQASAPDLYADAWDRATSGDRLASSMTVKIAYYYAGGRQFDNCQINSFQVSVTAGDIANFTVDFFGTTVSNVAASPAEVCEKLITWDVCSVTGTLPATDAQATSVTINNQLQRVYKVNQPNLFPVDILAGIRDVTGNVSFYINGALPLPYGSGGFSGAQSWGSYTAAGAGSITFGFNVFDITVAKLAWHRAEAAAQTGPAIFTANFTGVCLGV